MVTSNEVSRSTRAVCLVEHLSGSPGNVFAIFCKLIYIFGNVPPPCPPPDIFVYGVAN